MKTFRQFMEMPLSSYKSKFVGEPDEREGFQKKNKSTNRGLQVYWDELGKEREITGRFTKKDRTVITHPRTLQTLERRLSGGRHRFNILLIERKDDRYDRQAEAFIRENGIQTAGHITFVKNGTSGHVMTPWMILHTLAHAVTSRRTLRDNPKFSWIEEKIDLFGRSFKGLMSKLCGLNVEEERFVDLVHASDMGDCLGRAGEVFMFKSAQNDSADKVQDLEEFLHEIIAEYLWNGDRIRVKPTHQQDAEIKGIVGEMERVVGGMLDDCVGEIIYDEFE